VNSLPQLLADGEATFRAPMRSTTGGTNSGDGWWITREGSFQVAAYNAGNTGIEFIHASTLGRMFAAIGDQRVLMDRSSGTIYVWRDPPSDGLLSLPSHLSRTCRHRPTSLRADRLRRGAVNRIFRYPAGSLAGASVTTEEPP
jgi:hypothetical protein